ncbi:MAG: hypothetical protein HY866_23530 [Chloroflexi bacterium]|nr:hypothetical protein [Chloroflexota bacterium]
MKLPLKKRFLSCLQHWPLFIALPLFALILSYYEYLFMDAPFLWWARSTFYHAPWLALVITPMGLASVFLWLLVSIARENSSGAVLRNAGVSLVLLAFVNLNMCIATVFTVFGNYRHHDTERLGCHIYHLDSEWKVGVGMASQALFSLSKCDPTGSICEIVYAYRYLNDDGSSLVSEDEYRAIKASLVTDSKARSITIQIDGLSIYTYSP